MKTAPVLEFAAFGNILEAKAKRPSFDASTLCFVF
jgi:hypothetical protein